MSIIRTLPFAALSATLLAAGGAAAQSMSSIDAREAYEQREIDRGIRNGSLTPNEAYRLQNGLDRVERYEQRARADGIVTPYEHQRLDRMLDREQHSIYRESHDAQRTDGRGWYGRDGWGRDGWRHDGYGYNHGWDRDGGNRGIEGRDARNEQRIYDGVRDGSINRREFGQLERGQERIDRYEARARADGVVTPYERNRIDQMQNRESRQIYADRHNAYNAPGTPPTNGTQPGTGSHNWGGFQGSPQAGNTPPTAPTQPGTHNWGGYRTQQFTPINRPTQPANGGYRMQQASAAPTQAPTMTHASAAPAPTGGRTFGGR
jgi:hypothetical protein